ncbi:GNAT family N-acetyltransferase [Actinoallomurus sp. NBC_01490]|uniref:GNAT family N-acetyltransferase n=1 Tax=Actinoallomurus sp. NBC_01490 TaxID=2903557 RepID=UPI002E34376B|nr:GNAT family N-acetyltransferase [Actinoallomurus sp. NBC_01490]
MPSWSPCSIPELLDLTGHDPLIRGTRGAGRGPAWRGAGGRAVAFTGYDVEGRIRSLVALGPPDETAELVAAVHGELPEGIRVIVPRGTPLPLSRPSDWNFRAAYGTPPPQPAEAAVGWCDDEDAVTELLTLVSPGTSAWPGDPKVRRWAGVRRDGRLLACLADTTAADGVGHVSAIAVHPEARGRGLGPSITAWAMRRMFAAGCDVVTLGVYADNAVGLRMYDRLGFTVDRALTTGLMKRPA